MGRKRVSNELTIDHIVDAMNQVNLGMGRPEILALTPKETGLLRKFHINMSKNEAVKRLKKKHEPILLWDGQKKE